MTKINYKIWFLWVLTVIFFSYQFILRLTPGVLMDDIMIRHQISASTFGFIISFYYIGYAGMQIPTGIFLDRYGVRKVVAFGSLICAIGNLSFLIYPHWIIDLFGRFLIGIGSAAGALGAIHCVRLYFPHRHMSKMIGFTVTMSLLGAIYGKSINRFLSKNFGYQETVIYLAIPGVVIALLLLFLTKDEDFSGNIAPKTESGWASLKEVLGNSQIIWLSIAGALMVGSLESFADVFGEPFLTAVYNFPRADAGYLTTSTIYLGFCIGAPLLATIADRFNFYYTINITCGAMMALIFHLMFEKLLHGYKIMFLATFILGIMSAYQVIVISTVANIVPERLNGVAIAVVNMINMAAGMGFNASIGSLLDLYWTGEVANGKRIYSEIAYIDALYILPVTAMFGAIIFFILKPTRTEISKKN